MNPIEKLAGLAKSIERDHVTIRTIVLEEVGIPCVKVDTPDLQPGDEVEVTIGHRESENERTHRELVEYLNKYVSDSDTRKKCWLSYLEKQKEYHVPWYDYQKSREAGYTIVPNEEYEQLIKQKEQPDIEHLQQSWYMEGYHDGKWDNEPKWIVQTGEGGPKYELNPKYGQKVEEQKPATFNEPYNPDEYEAVEIGNATGLRQKEQKPAEWSEEDEKHINNILDILDYWKATTHFVSYQGGTIDADITWLKSLHPQPNPIVAVDAEQLLKILPQKQGWDEVDKRILHGIKQCIYDNVVNIGTANKVKYIDWLESLRPSWKPSEEQMNGLAHAINLDVYDAKRYELDSLYNDLKKLM